GGRQEERDQIACAFAGRPLGTAMLILVDIVPPADLQQAKDSVVERWLKKPGEPVRLHEPLLEINTDKATIEVASPAEGVLHEILKQTGETVRASDVLGHIAVGEGAATPTAAVKPP